MYFRYIYDKCSMMIKDVAPNTHIITLSVKMRVNSEQNQSLKNIKKQHNNWLWQIFTKTLLAPGTHLYSLAYSRGQFPTIKCSADQHIDLIYISATMI